MSACHLIMRCATSFPRIIDAHGTRRMGIDWLRARSHHRSSHRVGVCCAISHWDVVIVCVVRMRVAQTH